MSRSGKFVVVASAIWLVVSEVITAHRTTNGMLLSLLITLLFLGVCLFGFLRVFAEWRQRQWRAVIPLGVCIFSLLIFIPLGRLVSRAVLAWSLPSYERIVGQFESGSIPVPAEYGEVPQAEPEARLAYGVFAEKDTNGILTVIFLTEEGFPALHSGYMYRSSGELGSDIASRWPTTERVRAKWFYISN